MNTIRKGIPSALEVQYSELKKQAAVDNRTPNRPRETVSDMPVDIVTLSSVKADGENPPRRKPSNPVTTAEKQALKIQFSVYA